MFRKLAILFLSVLSYLFLVFPVFAQGITPLRDSGCLAKDAAGNVIAGNVASLDCIPVIVGNVVFWLLLLAGIAALILVIISGFKFVTSGGDPKQAEGARKTLTYAIIGLVVVLFSFAIISFIEEVTGLDKNCVTRFGFSQCVPEDIAHACSDAYPNGYCSEGQSCVRTPGLREFSCKYPCSDAHRNGWCSGGKDCTRIEANFWSCR